MKTTFRFTKSRFHIDYGPQSLFERVLFKFKFVTELQIHGKHFIQRSNERRIPEEVINELFHFDINIWEIKQAEVRNDTGKFVSTTWERVIDGSRYWVVVGFGNTVETIIIKKHGSGQKGVVTKGEIYDLVDEVNRRLMDEESAQ